MDTSFVPVGDINTVFGESVRDILSLLDLTNVVDLSYLHIPDEVYTPT